MIIFTVLPLWVLLLQAAQNGGGILTLERVLYIAGLLLLLASNVYTYRNNKASTIHSTDTKTIASLSAALKRAEDDLKTYRPDAEQLPSVKRELVALMAISVHELLDYAALKRERDALERECQRLQQRLQERLTQKGGPQ